MEINTEHWGLDKQYHFITDEIPGIYIFPQVTEYNILQYLIDMEFGCFVLTTANDGKLYPTILNSRYLLKYYSKSKLVPVSKEQKKAIIKLYHLELIVCS